MKRTGIIAKKMGMTRLFTESGDQVAVTVLHLQGCQVVAHKTRERDGYNALLLGAGSAKPGRVAKAQRVRFATAAIEPKVKLVEFQVSEEAFIPIGSEILANHFPKGHFVDVTGISLGKGFAGAMKRWNFGGLRASHGVSISHRSHGSTGGRQDPGKTFKNKKMAGHLGTERVTILNLSVAECDVEKGILLVKGAVPGHAGSWVFVRDAIKRPLSSSLPLPASFVSREFISSPLVLSSPSEETFSLPLKED